MTRTTTWDTTGLLEELQSGVTFKEASIRRGVPYGWIWHYATNHGIKGGRRQRDRRPVLEKIKAHILVHENGCVEWQGPVIAFDKNARCKSDYGKLLFGTDFNYGRRQYMRSCDTKYCLNQDHYQGRNQGDYYNQRYADRDKAIAAIYWRFRESREALISMMKTHGITRQRVHQIAMKEGTP